MNTSKLRAEVHATMHPRFGERVAVKRAEEFRTHIATPAFALAFITGYIDGPRPCFIMNFFLSGGGTDALRIDDEGNTWCSLEKDNDVITPEDAAKMVGG